jgi:hypothetical protein
MDLKHSMITQPNSNYTANILTYVYFGGRAERQNWDLNF